MTRDMRPIFEPGAIEHLLRNWTPEQIAAASVSRKCIASALCFFGRMDGYSDPATYAPQGMIDHIRMRVTESPAYDEWAASRPVVPFVDKSAE